MPATDLLFILDGNLGIMDSDRMGSYQKFLLEMVPKFKIGRSDTQVNGQYVGLGILFYSTLHFRVFLLRSE